MEYSEAILQITNVSKSFPGVKALDAINLDIVRGEVHFWSMEYNMRESEIERIQFDAPESSVNIPGCC